MHADGKIEIVRTDVMDTELGDRNKQLRLKSEKYPEDLGVMVWGHSRWGHAVWAGARDRLPIQGDKRYCVSRLQPDEKRIEEKFSIIALTPDECLTRLSYLLKG